ncbi:MAG TPA: hypothetical protein VN890_07485, partial [Methylocella sp.]|nr:hypothetical protein [Methylocella sp.]
MATQTDAAAPAASEFNTWRRTKLSWRVLSRGATGVAGSTNLAIRPTGLGKKPKTQLRSAPLKAGLGKVDRPFEKDLLQLIDIERFSLDQLIPRDREQLENPAKDSTAPEACQTLLKQFPLSFRMPAIRAVSSQKIILWYRSRCQIMP